MLCDYGCGRKAKYQFKNGKWCCSASNNSCPEVQKKVSKSKMFTIEQIQEKHPIFAKEEEMRYNPDKLPKKEIQIHCKYRECSNSKENGGWFIPTYIQLYERIRQLEHKDGNDGGYLYCSEECKQECGCFNVYSDPYRLNEKKKYTDKVLKETYITLKKFSDKIKNIELRGLKYSYELDHKYTIYDGFENGVNPKIIAHWKNLECIPMKENREKNKNSTLTLEELLKNIKKGD